MESRATMWSVRLESMKRNSITGRNVNLESAGTLHPPLNFQFPLPLSKKRSLTLAVYSSKEDPSLSHLTSSIASPSISLHWNLTQRHITIFNLAACLTSLSAAWLFFSAIPAILAFKRAAESMEKLLDVTRQELPDTMASIRLSGMEISDLTTELSDMGQGITRGVRSSTQAVRIAEESLRGLTNNNMNITASMQVVGSPRTKPSKPPAVAVAARSIKEGIRKGRTSFQIFLTFTQLSRLAINYLAKRAKQKSTLNM